MTVIVIKKKTEMWYKYRSLFVKAYLGELSSESKRRGKVFTKK